jgi:hypothetical protein
MKEESKITVKPRIKEPGNFDFRLKWFLYNLISHYSFFLFYTLIGTFVA